jgi:peptidoglycan hydrolase CwlO-like protein
MNNETSNVDNRVTIIESIEIPDYSDEIANIHNDITTINGNISNLNNEISNIDNRVTILESIEIPDYSDEIANIHNDITTINRNNI